MELGHLHTCPILPTSWQQLHPLLLTHCFSLHSISLQVPFDSPDFLGSSAVMHESTKTPTPSPTLGQGGDLGKTLVKSQIIPPPLGMPP